MKSWEAMTEDERIAWAEKARENGLGKYTVEELIEYRRLQELEHRALNDLTEAEEDVRRAKDLATMLEAEFAEREKALSDYRAKIDKDASERSGVAHG